MNNFEHSKTLSELEQRSFLRTKFDSFDRECPTIDDLSFQYANWLMQEYVEPIHLTVEERKAVELAVKMETPYLRLIGKTIQICDTKNGFYFLIDRVPALKALNVDKEGYVAEWITETPIDLREVLKND